MKKAVSLIAAAAAAAAIASGLLVWRIAQNTPPPPVARFVPPETILLAEAPDWPRTQLRWRETALWKMIREPDVAAFLQRPRAWLAKNTPPRETMEHLTRAKVHRAFFALTAIRQNMPHAVAGFQFAGDRREVEAVVAKIRAQVMASSPGGKAEKIPYGTYAIESFTDQGVTIAGAFARDWYLFGNDVALLKSTLDRVAAPKIQGSLAGEKPFIQCTAQLPRQPDFQFFAQPTGFADALTAHGSPDSGHASELRKIHAVAGAMRQEGERLHDTVFLLRPEAPRQPTLTWSTLGLTSPNTLFYCAFAPLIPDKVEVPAETGSSAGATNTPAISQVLGGLRAMAAEFAGRGVQSGAFKTALGPEFAVISDWPENALQPTLQFAGQVRDAAAARKLAQEIADGAPPSPLEGTEGFWELAASDSQYAPVLALTKRFLLGGLGPENLKTLVARDEAAGITLEKSQAFSTTIASVTKPGIAVVYLDSKAFFERLYGWLRPMAVIWANFIPHAADYIEVRKLPSTESISKHLSPMIFSASQNKDGVVLESSGPVTFFQAATVLGGGCSAAALPLLESKLLPGLAVPKK